MPIDVCHQRLEHWARPFILNHVLLGVLDSLLPHVLPGVLVYYGRHIVVSISRFTKADDGGGIWRSNQCSLHPVEDFVMVMNTLWA